MVILCTQVSSASHDYRSGPEWSRDRGRSYHQGVSTNCRQQAFIEAPLDRVWALASDPERQTEWWPDTITFECIDGDFGQGCHVRNVQSRPWPMSDLETTLEVGPMIPGKELTIRCMDTGTYTGRCSRRDRAAPSWRWRRATTRRTSPSECRSPWPVSGCSGAGSSTRWRGSARPPKARRWPVEGHPAA